MNRKQNTTSTGDGRLPAVAPLANPYVPFQEDNPAMYEPRKALVRGTLFCGLDLPFMGMVNKNEKKVTPLTELQTMAFAIQELALYLDTHRNDAEALELYRSFQRLYKQGCEEYEQKYGPLTHSFVSNGEYKWLDEPWPWEYARNQEV